MVRRGFQEKLVPIVLGLSLSGLVHCGDCDPSLISDSGNPLSYQQRDGRCEGLYVEQVAGSVMLPVGLMAARHGRAKADEGVLFLSWSQPPWSSPDIHIRAKGTRWRLHYRMDTSRSLSDGHFRWSTAVLDALGIADKELAALGWIDAELGGVERVVYLPLSVSGETGKPLANDMIHMVLIPSVPLSEAYLSLAKADRDGNPEGFIIDGEPLRYGYYPAHRALSVPLQGLSAPGLYYVELSARLRNGGSSVLTLLFHHDGP